MLRWEALKEVGLFDERFFLYAEETDWQRRALGFGWRSALCPDAVGLHVGAGTATDVRQREALFHAGQETYIRKWYGTRGWWGYRSAACVGAVGRAVLLTGKRRTEAARRALLYARGPRRCAGHRFLAHRRCRPSPRRGHTGVRRRRALRLYHGCRSLLSADGTSSVVGGNPLRMPHALRSRVQWLPGGTPSEALRSLASLGRQDVCHAHMTAAEGVAVAALPIHRARVVSTRHFAARRGRTPFARALAPLIAASLSKEIAISEFVASRIERRPDAILTECRTVFTLPLAAVKP